MSLNLSNIFGGFLKKGYPQLSYFKKKSIINSYFLGTPMDGNHHFPMVFPIFFHFFPRCSIFPMVFLGFSHDFLWFPVVSYGFPTIFPWPHPEAGRRLARSAGGAALRPAEQRSAARAGADAERRGRRVGLGGFHSGGTPKSLILDINGKIIRKNWEKQREITIFYR